MAQHMWGELEGQIANLHHWFNTVTVNFCASYSYTKS